ncbi:hypothetical protein BKA66DRAFT_581921 [Pyrenochaeta sp. MPI-SDFR-AT-0127]|nr:hypothetical protein BKA66DRAFT_581921 [Pyrenochaeta sp. MPI-SDFR-AT-0127]
MTRDSTGQTLFAVPHGQENIDGLVYSQFYALIKTPFDTSKTYVFHYDALENLALDPGYVRSLWQQGGGVNFSSKVCQLAYLHGKRRAHANLVDNRWKSYRIQLLGFLYAQINKYCFLFEYTLAHTARTYSLPETMVMVAALRALRFCYSSSMMRRESLLYKDRWEQNRGVHVVVREGLGMQETIERCGLGCNNMLIGTLLMHDEYKRQ